MVLGFALLAIALGPLAATAGAAWSTPTPLSATGVTSATVVAGPGGDAIAVWKRAEGSSWAVEARRIPVDGPPGPVLGLSGTADGTSRIVIAIDAQGDAIVAWDRGSGASAVVRARRVPADGPLGDTHDLATGGNVEHPDVAVDHGGDAIVVWRRTSGSDRIVQARRIPAGAAPEGVTLTLSAFGGNASSPSVVADAEGDALAVWTRFDGTDSIAQARVVPEGGPPGPITYDLSAPGGSAQAPQPALDAQGGGIVAWVRSDGSGLLVQARRVAAGSPTGPVVEVGNAPIAPPDLRVAVDADGDATAVWRGYDGQNAILQGRRVPAAAPPEPLMDLSAPGLDAYQPAIAVDAQGTAIAMWSGGDGQSGNVQSRAVPEGASPDPTIHDASPGGTVATNPSVDAKAGPVAVWEQSEDGLEDQIVFSRFVPQEAGGGAPPAGGPAAPGAGPGAGTPGVGAPPATLDRTAPILSRVSLSRRRFRVARRATARRAAARTRTRRRRARAGTRLRFTLSEPAQVRIRVERRRPGRRVRRRGRRRCVRPAPRLRNRRRCVRWRRAGVLVRRRGAGRGRVALSGRIRRRALRPGRYRLRVAAIDAAGNRSRQARLRFRIVRR